MKKLQQIVTSLFERLAWAEDIDDLIAELQSGSYGDPVPVIAAFLADPDTSMQLYAINALMHIDSERAIDYVLPRMKEPHWHLTLCSWFARGGDERTVMPLVEVLLSSDDADTRLIAALALKRFGDARAIPALEYVRDHDQEEDHDGHSIREMAIAALEAIASRRPTNQNENGHVGA